MLAVLIGDGLGNRIAQHAVPPDYLTTVHDFRENLPVVGILAGNWTVTGTMQESLVAVGVLQENWTFVDGFLDVNRPVAP